MVFIHYTPRRTPISEHGAMAAHAAYIRAVQGSSPCVPTNNASFVSGEATGLQNRQDQFDSDTMLQHALVSQSEDYLATNESVAGSSPVGSTNIVL